MVTKKDPTSIRSFIAASFASQSESELERSAARLSLGATGSESAALNALTEVVGRNLSTFEQKDGRRFTCRAKIVVQDSGSRP